MQAMEQHVQCNSSLYILKSTYGCVCSYGEEKV